MKTVFLCSPEECKECHDHTVTTETAAVHHTSESPAAAEPLKERPGEEVAARLAQQDQDEQDLVTCKFSVILQVSEKVITDTIFWTWFWVSDGSC